MNYLALLGINLRQPSPIITGDMALNLIAIKKLRLTKVRNPP